MTICSSAHTRGALLSGRAQKQSTFILPLVHTCDTHGRRFIALPALHEQSDIYAQDWTSDRRASCDCRSPTDRTPTRKTTTTTKFRNWLGRAQRGLARQQHQNIKDKITEIYKNTHPFDIVFFAVDQQSYPVVTSFTVQSLVLPDRRSLRHAI